MFTAAILIGIYSYLIFSLGILGILYRENIFFVTLIFIFISLLLYRKKILTIRLNVNNLPTLLFAILIFQAIVNLVGALGPELGFDALWYHLTLPKIFLENHKIIHIPGGLLYYSDMPKLTEMIYTSLISLFNEIASKLTHFLFGIFTLIAIYKISRKFLNKKFSIISCIIFYSNLVVGWQSTTAYIDLIRTFFELMAIWSFINWEEAKTNSAKRGWFIESAVMVGLAISTKLLSLGLLVIFPFLFFYIYKVINKKLILSIFYFLFIALYVAIPWFLLSYFSTGNPIYPLFSNYVKESFNINQLSPLIILKTFWELFTHSSNPISPIYILYLPFILLAIKKFDPRIKIIAIYTLASFLLWYLIPANDSRYIMPALASFSVIISYTIFRINSNKFFRYLSFSTVILIAVISIIYRGFANLRYVPVVLGKESKTEFLVSHLNFSYGDFYDTDGYFKTHIKQSDKVLLYGFHNLYYVNFPFIDSSYVRKGNKFNYIATQQSDLPDRFKFWKEVYSNPKTGVRLYSLEGQAWIY